MTPLLCRCFLVFCLAACAGTAAAEELLVELKGTGTALTDEFAVDGPWLLDYNITSEYPAESGIEITMVDAVFLDHEGIVLKSREPTSGTKLFYDSGRFRFRITSTFADWRLRISKISKEEAEAMVPLRPAR